MKKMYKFGIPILFAGRFLIACQESESDVTSMEEITLEKNLVKDESRDLLVANLAQNLAGGLQNESVRSFIKEKTIEQFDGDYNFLIEESKNQEVLTEENGRVSVKTFGEVLASGIGSNSGGSTSIDLDVLGELHPLLQVALPQLALDSAESWNIKNETLLVAFLPSDYDESTSETIPAYDAEGNYFELSAKEEPNELVLVISDNERLIAIPKKAASKSGRVAPVPVDECLKAATPYFENETHSYYLKDDAYPIINDCHGGGGGGTGGGTGGGSNSCDRETNNDRDYLNKAMFKDYGTIRQVESWASGKPEVRMIVSFAQANSSSGFNFTGLSYAMGENGWFKRKWLNEWATMKNFDYQIVRWDPETYGDRMYYAWIEEDPSLASASFNVNVGSTFNFLNFEVANVNANGTATFSIGGADDIIAQPVEVKFCDNTDGEGFEYRSPMIFYINQQ